MELVNTLCTFCKQVPFKYTCPKCNKLYCCLACFRAAEHKTCTSSFGNIFDQSTSYTEWARNDAILRYVCLKNALEKELNAGGPINAESVDSFSESISVWSGDGCDQGGDGDFQDHDELSNDSDDEDEVNHVD